METWTGARDPPPVAVISAESQLVIGSQGREGTNISRSRRRASTAARASEARLLVRWPAPPVRKARGPATPWSGRPFPCAFLACGEATPRGARPVKSRRWPRGRSWPHRRSRRKWSRGPRGCQPVGTLVTVPHGAQARVPPSGAVRTPQPASPHETFSPLSPSSVSSPRGERDPWGHHWGPPPGRHYASGHPHATTVQNSGSLLPLSRQFPVAHESRIPRHPGRTLPRRWWPGGHRARGGSFPGMNSPCGNRSGEAKRPPGAGLTHVPDHPPSGAAPPAS